MTHKRLFNAFAGHGRYPSMRFPAKVLQDNQSLIVRGTGSIRIARISRIDDAVAGATPLQS
ncbi:MAG: hypothetical protein ACRCWJ_01920, partial [Casimicrobium sp.]